MTAAPDPPRPSASQIAAVVVGNGLQFYDFLTYAFFATQIGRTFFPSKDPAIGLLASLATFGVGYLTRPIGAVVIGVMGDRMGRRPAMVLSFALMGAGMVGLAATPSFAQIGVAAPIIAIAFRLLQGFALGGEVGPSTAFLVEAAPPDRRGFYVSMQYATQDAAVLAAGTVGLVLANVFSPAALDQWGWRVAFLIGAAVVPLGLILRRGLPETIQASRAAAGAADDRSDEGSLVRRGVLGLIMLSAATTCFVILNYMTTFAASVLGMASNIAFAATVTVGGCGVVFDLVGGRLSDRFGRRPVMLAPWLFLLAVVFPCFWAIIHWRTPAVLLAATAILTIPGDIATAAVLTSVTESMPRRTRSGSIAILYALSATVFGGSTQFNVTWLIRETGSPFAPAWYMATAIAVGLAAMALMPETAPRSRRSSTS